MNTKKHKIIIPESEYINIATHKHLIGKRAKFKEDSRYTKSCWNRTGKIFQDYQVVKGDLNHVGLSLKLDIPIRQGYCNSMVTKSLYIKLGSFELI